MRPRGLLTCLLVLAPALVLGFHSFCDLLFSCGCRPLWAGGLAHCNIHTPGVPHCPFCAGGAGRLSWILGTVAVATLLGVALGLRRRGLPGGILGGLLGSCSGGLLCGVIVARLDLYPRLLGLRLPWG